MILYINACVREQSRTEELAQYLLSKLNDSVQEVTLSEQKFPVADRTFLHQRSYLTEKGNFSDPLFEAARTFAAADTIIVAAPYWDLSFPAALKQYFEQVNVLGVTFLYTEEGVPKSLCQAQRLYYITTAGGQIFSDEYGYGYIKALAKNFYHIPQVNQIKAEGLDIQGADVSAILYQAKSLIDGIIQ